MPTPVSRTAFSVLEQLAAQQRRQPERRLVEHQDRRVPTSARGRSPPSAARRRSSCAPAARCARPGSGTGRARAADSAPPAARARAARRRRAAGSRAPIRSPKMPRPSGTSARPASTMRCGGWSVTAWPSSRTWLEAAQRHHAGHRLQQRGLAGAVGAEDDDDLARRDVQVHALERRWLAVGDGQVLCTSSIVVPQVGADHLGVGQRLLRACPRRSWRRCSSPRSGRTGCGSRPSRARPG